MENKLMEAVVSLMKDIEMNSVDLQAIVEGAEYPKEDIHSKVSVKTAQSLLDCGYDDTSVSPDYPIEG